MSLQPNRRRLYVNQKEQTQYKSLYIQLQGIFIILNDENTNEEPRVRAQTPSCAVELSNKGLLTPRVDTIA